MKFTDPGSVVERLDMDEQQLLLICLFHSIGTERLYEMTVQAVEMLRENGREEAAEIMQNAARKMIT